MTAPAVHPAWCERAHGEMPRHEAQIGADLALDSGLTFAVYLAQRDGEPAEVELMQHDAEETSLTGFSILQAAILRDLLGEALGVLARERGL